MTELLDQLLNRIDAGETVAVCVVARTRGSTPQKAGAIMLVTADGRTVGTLGGGCVEAEVRTRALSQIATGHDAMLTFKLDHDYGWDDGLVCGGTMQIATMIVRADRSSEAWRGSREALERGAVATMPLAAPDESGVMQAFELTIESTPQLIIAGAGHVGAALAQIARPAGFELTVIDDRPDYANTDRFAGARCIVGAIEDELARLTLGESSYVVIVTRGHKRDAQALSAVIGSEARYIGLIGSKRKILTILQDLRAAGTSMERIARVHAPIGLEIGAISPQEIAISIAAELIAVRRGAPLPAGSMRLTAEQLARVSRAEG